MTIFLAKRPRVESYALTKAYFDGLSPLILRFKLTSGICTEFLQIFLDRIGGNALFEEHYTIRPAEGLRILKDPETNQLERISLVIPAARGFFDLYLDPVLDLSQGRDKTIELKVLKGDSYSPVNSYLTGVLGASRVIYFGRRFGVKDPKSFRLGEWFPYSESLDPDIVSVPNYEPEPEFEIGEYALYSENTDPSISLLINYDENLYPGLSEPTPVVQFSQGRYSFLESSGNSGIVLSLIRSGINIQSTSTVRVDITGGTATLGEDYLREYPLYITFAPGESSISLSKSILPDNIFDPNETILVALSPHLNATIGDVNTATIRIV